MTVKDLVSHMIPDECINIAIISCNGNNEMEIVARSDDIRDKITGYYRYTVLAWLLRSHTLQIIVKP